MKLGVASLPRPTKPRAPLAARINVDSDGVQFVATVALPKGITVFGSAACMSEAVSDLFRAMRIQADSLRVRKRHLSDVKSDELFVLDHVLTEGRP
jgi:hypothetical protein